MSRPTADAARRVDGVDRRSTRPEAVIDVARPSRLSMRARARHGSSTTALRTPSRCRRSISEHACSDDALLDWIRGDARRTRRRPTWSRRCAGSVTRAEPASRVGSVGSTTVRGAQPDEGPPTPCPLYRADEVWAAYLFTLRADEIFDVAEVTRINRSRSNELIGYQRAEVRQHVEDILEYLNGDDVLFPNSIILALSASVRFDAAEDPRTTTGSPRPACSRSRCAEGGAPPAWIVDGQQRALALREPSAETSRCRSAPSSPRLSRSSATSSFASTTPSRCPAAWSPNCFPRSRSRCLGLGGQAGAVRDLRPAQRPTDSPFRGLIRRASTPRGSGAVITDTSVIDMLRESICSPSGCLFPYRNLATGETDFDAIWRIVVTYWSGVRDASRRPGEGRPKRAG